MYSKILVALENSQADESLLPHVAQLAERLGPSCSCSTSLMAGLLETTNI